MKNQQTLYQPTNTEKPVTLSVKTQLDWEKEFDEKFKQRNDCSNFYNRHRSDCQGCVKIIVEEPEDIKDFIKSHFIPKQAVRETVDEAIGKDQKPILENLERMNPSLLEYGSHVNYLRNILRKQIRERLKEKGLL